MRCGDGGASPQDAIVTKGVTSHYNQIDAEFAYPEMHYGKCHKDWKMIRQSLVETDDGTPVDALGFTVGD